MATDLTFNCNACGACNRFASQTKPKIKPKSSVQKANRDVKEYLDSLSDDVKEIDVSRRGLTFLPNLDRFTELKTLYCHFNKLTELPTLPNELQELNCSHNNLSFLPALPNSLQTLYCYNNKLIKLPALPNSLRKLNCRFNEIWTHPDLPNELEEWDLSDNNLTKTPVKKTVIVWE